MHAYSNLIRLITLCLLAMSCGYIANAQPAVPIEEWEKRQNAHERLTVFGEDIMGESIDPHTGSIQFAHADISIPGNSGLSVSLVRKRTQGFLYHATVDAEFGDWELVVPRIKVVSGAPWVGNRCSDQFGQTIPNVFRGRGGVLTHRSQHSNGVELHIPGMALQQLLESPEGNQWPSTATHVTTQNFYLFCASASDGG
ncbi:MAG: hypothetical protein AAFO88_07370, partial [Pseudomonadota bacterium]